MNIITTNATRITDNIPPLPLRAVFSVLVLGVVNLRLRPWAFCTENDCICVGPAVPLAAAIPFSLLVLGSYLKLSWWHCTMETCIICYLLELAFLSSLDWAFLTRNFAVAFSRGRRLANRIWNSSCFGFLTALTCTDLVSAIPRLGRERVVTSLIICVADIASTGTKIGGTSIDSTAWSAVSLEIRSSFTTGSHGIRCDYLQNLPSNPELC